jgi:hypothetical protein
MNEELEGIVAADEEARARVLYAESRGAREISAAAAERDRVLRERRQDLEAQLERELREIAEAGDRELAAARAAHEQDRAALAESGTRELERAACLWARIVREGGVG